MSHRGPQPFGATTERASDPVADARRRARETGNFARSRRFSWSRLLWALIYPRRRQRVTPTIAGLLLVGLSFGIGLAAYNAANNILFITLALMLACLVLSGVLSWMNFRRVHWRLGLAAPARAGHDLLVTLAVHNAKRLLPTYGLWFDLAARALDPREKARAETTFTARSAEVKAALAQAAAAETRERIALPARLDPGEQERLEWVFRPPQRGRLRVRLSAVGSLFPFGFLQKQFATELEAEVLVWPAPTEYRRLGLAAAKRTTGGQRVARAGTGADLLALRRYQPGDSHRLIHWKASARSRRLLVRQFAAENAEAFALWLQTDAAAWPRADQFELLVSFAATLAEDLFRTGRLTSVAIDQAAPTPVRGLAEVEGWLDALATIVPTTGPVAQMDFRGAGRRRNVVTFAADGPRGVVALCDGQPLAAV